MVGLTWCILPSHCTVQPEFLASVMDEMTGLTSEISEELDKSCSGASVTNEVEVAMVAPEVTVVAPEESLESEPIVNGDGKSVEVGGWGLEYLWVGHGGYICVGLAIGVDFYY